MFKIQNGVAYEQTLAFAGTNEKLMKMKNMKDVCILFYTKRTVKEIIC